MSGVVVGHTAGKGAGGTTPTVDISGILQDNCEIVIFIYTDTSAVPTLTSNDSYTPATAVSSGTGVSTSDRRVGQIFYKDVADSLAENATPTWTASATLGDWIVIALAVTGLGAPATVLGENGRLTSSSSSQTTSTITPASSKKAFAVSCYGVNTGQLNEFASESLSGTNAGSTTENQESAQNFVDTTGITAVMATTPISLTSGSYTGSVSLTTNDVGIASLLIFELAPPPAPQLTANQPAATGLLSRIFKGKRTLSANQPFATAVVTSRHVFTRALAATQPFATAVLSVRRLRVLAANQPFATAALSRIGKYIRVLGANQPNPTTTLARIMAGFRALTADQPAATATLLAKILTSSRVLAGSQPAATATISYTVHRMRNLTADQPASTAGLSRSQQAARSLTANQPASSATLVRRAQVSRLLEANQPAPSAGLRGRAIFAVFDQVIRWIKGGRL